MEISYLPMKDNRLVMSSGIILKMLRKLYYNKKKREQKLSVVKAVIEVLCNIRFHDVHTIKSSKSNALFI